MPPTPDAEIAAATAEDIPAIRDLARKIWHACYPGMISARQIDHMLAWMYSEETLRREIEEGGIRYDLLRLAGLPVGYASYGPGEKERELKLHKLYVDPDHQRRGLGGLLLGHVEEFARRGGFLTIMLQVNRRNPYGLPLYRKHGFRIREERRSDIGGGFVMDDYIMEKPLGQAP